MGKKASKIEKKGLLLFRNKKGDGNGTESPLRVERGKKDDASRPARSGRVLHKAKIPLSRNQEDPQTN